MQSRSVEETKSDLEDARKWADALLDPSRIEVAEPLRYQGKPLEVTTPFKVTLERESTTAGKKFDAGKLRYDLVPPAVDAAEADVFTYGSGKYGDRNWEQGIKYSRLYAAARRHLEAWRLGEYADPESGLPHLAHAIVNLKMLLHFELDANRRAQRGLDKHGLDDVHADAA